MPSSSTANRRGLLAGSGSVTGSNVGPFGSTRNRRLVPKSATQSEPSGAGTIP